MVNGIATTKVTLDDDQLRAVRELISSGKADNVSPFVKHAVAVWADSILGARRGNRRDRRQAA